jgi:hypothetical protein
MFTKQLIRRAFGGQGKKETTLTILVSPKFPEGTIAGLYKRAVAENQYQDAVRFGAQKINWTLKEFDVNLVPMIIIIEILISLRLWTP